MTPDDLAAAGLRLDVAGPVATITLDRPERRNAQTPLMWRALGRLGAGLSDEVRVVVVRGDGRGLLGRPGPLAARPASPAPEGVESVAGCSRPTTRRWPTRSTAYQEGFTFLRDPRFVSIAAVQGHAIGAGFQLALSCDLRVVPTDAQFCMKEAALGLVPDLTGTKPLVDAVGYARALEICATARMVGAAEAVSLGLALRRCPPTSWRRPWPTWSRP